MLLFELFSEAKFRGVKFVKRRMHSIEDIAGLAKVVVNTRGDYGAMLGDNEVKFKRRYFRYLQGATPSEGGMFNGKLQGKASLLSWQDGQTIVCTGE